LRISNKFPRNYYSSLLEGFLERYGLMHSIRIYIPQREWNFFWAYMELEMM
jgi:hypothetical protein